MIRNRAAGETVATAEQLWQAALALPDTAEQDHHGMASFRVAGRIFATVPDADHVRLMLPEAEIAALVAEAPGTFTPVHWGKRLSAVAVELAWVDPQELAELLQQAYRAKAPSRLTRLLPGG